MPLAPPVITMTCSRSSVCFICFASICVHSPMREPLKLGHEGEIGDDLFAPPVLLKLPHAAHFGDAQARVALPRGIERRSVRRPQVLLRPHVQEWSSFVGAAS